MCTQKGLGVTSTFCVTTPIYLHTATRSQVQIHIWNFFMGIVLVEDGLGMFVSTK